jgi:hypothetical protein
MTIQTHILLGSRRLQPHAKDIDAAIVKALPFIEEKLPIKDIDIVVHDNPGDQFLNLELVDILQMLTLFLFL